MSLAQQLEIRKTVKRRKPTFLKQDAHGIKRLKKNWRQPRGRHSKFRFKLRSYRRHPSIGFSSPPSVRGLTREGYKTILVSNPSQLDTINEPITLSSTVGLKKKLAIAEKAKDKKIRILNLKDVDAFITSAKEALKKRQEAKKKKETKKKESKAERAKKAQEKEQQEKDKTAEKQKEEKEKQDKEEKRKVLEQK